MAERIIQVFVHNEPYKKVLRDSKYDYVKISACTVKNKPMIKEFHAAIVGSEKYGLSAYFNDAELKWENDKVIFEPIGDNDG